MKLKLLWKQNIFVEDKIFCLSHNIEKILRAKVVEVIFSTMDGAIMFAVQFAFVDNNIS